MQNSESSLSQDIRAIKRNWGSFWGSLFGESKNYQKYAYMRNPNSMADEVLYGAWVIIFFSTGFTLYYGVMYHYSIFKNSANPAWEAFAVGMALFVMVEFLTIFFGHRIVRSISNGFIRKGLPQFLLIIVLTVAVVWGFLWRFSITAKGFATVNAQKATQEAIQQKTDYKTLTADIDAQLLNISKMAEKGATSTWRGKVTADGLEVMKRNAKLADKLLSQKAMMIAQAQQRDSMLLDEKKAQIALTFGQQNEYGGKAEWLVILGIIVVGICERINYKSNTKEAHEAVTTEPATATAPPPPPTQQPQLYDLLADMLRRSGYQPPIAYPTQQQPTQEPQRRPIGFEYGTQYQYTVKPVDTRGHNTRVVIRSPHQLLADLNQYTLRIKKQELEKGKASEANLRSHSRIFNQLIEQGYHPVLNGDRYVFANKEGIEA
jgi:hypothetical protein